MKSTQQCQKRQREAGNVLFLILIAVALFAALSYAVTQSTRSGGGDASKEKSLVSSASVTQYPASIKTAIVRMIVSNGVTANELLFHKPVDFTDLTTAALQKRAVFYPTGGGATYTDGPLDVSSTTTGNPWVFNATNEVKNIGTTATSGVTTATADIIAFLPNMSASVCSKIHEQLGMSSTVNTPLTGVDITTNMDDETKTDNIPASPGGAMITAAGVLDGQPQGCFQKAPGNLVYYHVLVER